MKTLFVIMALAIASPALAWDDWDTQQQQLQESGRFQLQQLQDMANANAAAMQQRQQAQFNWGAQCAARNYQNCY